jgi:putative transposase
VSSKHIASSADLAHAYRAPAEQLRLGNPQLAKDWPVNRRAAASRKGLNRYIREAFLAEATHQGIGPLEELSDLFGAWAEQVCNKRVHSETGETPISRFEKGGPHRAGEADQLREAFRWSVTRRVTRTATVPFEGNSYAVDPVLVGRRIELRYDPEDLSLIEVYFEGKRAGAATPFVTRRHVHRAVPQAARKEPVPTSG